MIIDFVLDSLYIYTFDKGDEVLESLTVISCEKAFPRAKINHSPRVVILF